MFDHRLIEYAIGHPTMLENGGMDVLMPPTGERTKTVETPSPTNQRTKQQCPVDLLIE